MGFWACSGSTARAALVLFLAVLGVAALAGAAMALIHAFLVITLRANQIVSGLALTIFAGAARAVVVPRQRPRASRTLPPKHQFDRARRVRARRPAGRRADPLRPDRARLRVVGLARPRRRSTSARTRPGLNVRAVGESPACGGRDGDQRDAYRYAHTLAGGAFAGVARRVLQPRDHAAVGRRATRRRRGLDRDRARHLRVLARRSSASSARTSSARSRRCRSRCRPAASTIAPELFQALPYVMTIVVLVLVSSGLAKRRLGAPAALGVPYVREER